MVKKNATFNKNSIIPAVISLEEPLIGQEREAERQARDMIAESRQKASGIRQQAERTMASIRDEERRRYLEETDETVRAIEDEYRAKLDRLKAAIDHNRKKTLARIMDELVPPATSPASGE